MESKVLRTGKYTPPKDDGSSGLKTRYFSDGSAIIVTEKGITLIESVGRYEVRPQSKELEHFAGLLTPPAES
jgi:hypothetical protein